MGQLNGIEQPTIVTEVDRFGHLLLLWQEDENDAALSQLLQECQPLIESVASRTLQTAGLDAGSFVDDTLSLVIDHVRRLPRRPAPPTSHGERAAAAEQSVMPFLPRSQDQAAGRRFLTWLTKRRAADVARRHRRQGKLAGSFSAFNPDRLRRAVTDAAIEKFADEKSRRKMADKLAWLRGMLGQLNDGDRLLMELSLEGKTLAVIAHTLGCCEGTVTRRRQRIENWLRENAPPPPPVPSGGLRKHHRPPAVNEDPILKDHPDRPGEDELLDVPPRLGHPIG